MATKPRLTPVKPLKPGSKQKLIITTEFLEEVKILAGRGLTSRQMCDYFEVAHSTWFDTIQRSPELGLAVRQGKAKIVSRIAGKLVEAALGGSVAAMIFYLKTQAGFSEKATNMGDGDKPTQPLTIPVTDPVEAARIYQQIMIGS
jgi:hypothetical protein